LLTESTLLEACAKPKKFLEETEKDLKILEFFPEAWIWTPATIWTIIKDMKDIEMITVDKWKVVVWNTWESLWKLLPDNMKGILFTAEMEEKLDKITNWELELKKFLDDTYKSIQKEVIKNKESIEEVKSAWKFWWTETKNKCPNCWKNLVENSKTLSCDCWFTLWKKYFWKTITKTQLNQLIKDWKTKKKVKLKSKAWKDYEAFWVLDKKTWKVSISFD